MPDYRLTVDYEPAILLVLSVKPCTSPYAVILLMTPLSPLCISAELLSPRQFAVVNPKRFAHGNTNGLT
jgi:hypothetical protein